MIKRLKGAIGLWLIATVSAGGLPQARAQQAPAATQITYDGSLNGLPGHTGAPITTTGATTTIPDGTGATIGNNLFHSFGLFDVQDGDTADFTGPASIVNIIARVTGGQQSDIYGALKSSITDANLFFMNPAGIFFGPNASLDLSGSFNIATSDYLEFDNGERFYAEPSAPPPLVGVNPADFGFLGAPRGMITVDGAKLRNPGEDLRIATSDMNIFNGGFLSSTPDGIGNSGDITVNTANLTLDGNSVGFSSISSEILSGLLGNSGNILVIATGDATLKNGGAISSRNAGFGNSGDIILSVGQLTIDGSPQLSGLFSESLNGSSGYISVFATGNIDVKDGGMILSDGYNTAVSGGIDISVLGNVILTNGSILSSRTFGSGNGGDINLTADNLIIDGAVAGGAGLLSDATVGSTGNAGNISISLLGNLTLDTGGVLSSHTFGPGDAGEINLIADNLIIDKAALTPTGIFSDAIIPSSGNAGNISIFLSGDATINNGGRISLKSDGVGNSGNVSITADNLRIDGTNAQGGFTGIFSFISSGLSGDVGEITISTNQDVILENGGVIFSGTNGSGQIGEVFITADNLTIDGSSSGIGTPGFFNSSSNGGNIVISTIGDVFVTDGGQIFSSALGSGLGGDISIDAENLTIDGFLSIISSFATSNDGGDITVSTTGDVVITNGGQVSSSTFGSGNGGGIVIDAENILIDGLTSIVSSNANSGSSGDAGQIMVSATENIIVRNGAQISSSTFSSGLGGRVNITANDLMIDGGPLGVAGIFAQANPGSSGAAGQVSVATVGDVTLTNGGLISSNTFGSGDSGDVNVKAANLTIDGFGAPETGILSAAEINSSGAGGQVSITTTGDITITNGGEITTETFGSGDGGDINTTAANLVIKNGSTIKADTSGTGRGGSITLNLADISLDDSEITSSSQAGNGGTAGTIKLDATNQLTVNNGSKIATDAADNDAGNIDITAPTVSLDNGEISSIAGGKGASGNINLMQPTGILAATNGSLIRTDTEGSGNAGNITLDLADAMLDASQITSSAQAGSTGTAGTIKLTTANQLAVNNGSKIATDAADNDAGNIDITAPTVSLDNGAISSIAGGQGASGSINLIQPTGILTATNGSSIKTDTTGIGDAGNITLDLTDISLDDSEITSNSNQTGSTGNAGQITIRAANAFNVTDQSLIATDALRANAGNINISGSTLNLNQGEISSTAGGGGSSGNILLSTSGLFTAMNGSTVQTDTTGTGLGGSITVDSGQTSLSQSQIRANSTSIFSNAGKAGNILVSAESQLDLQQSSITTTSKNADGGNIEILAPALDQPTIISLVDSEVSTSAQGGAGTGGNIFIDPTLLVLDNSQIKADAFEGSGGNITIIADALIRNPDSAITASSQFGLQGTININAPDTNALGGLAELPSNFFDTQSMMRVACGNRSGSNLSHFVVRGRGGMPSMPGDLNPGLVPAFETPTAAPPAAGSLGARRTAMSGQLMSQAGGCTL